jgi:hypothetical protein
MDPQLLPVQQTHFKVGSQLSQGQSKVNHLTSSDGQYADFLEQQRTKDEKTGKLEK